MARTRKRPRLRLLSRILPDRLANWTMRRFSGRVIEALNGAATDRFLELLLHGMGLSLRLCRGFRRNIEGFNARYVFTTRDGRVDVTADFSNGDMRVHDHAKDQCNVRVTFADSAAVQRFLFGKNQDILDSLLANEVEVDGNLNYLYKFGFMAKDLGHRLGVA